MRNIIIAKKIKQNNNQQIENNAFICSDLFINVWTKLKKKRTKQNILQQNFAHL